VREEKKKHVKHVVDFFMVAFVLVLIDFVVVGIVGGG